ncbi:MAG TPA: S8 family peptidase [Roseiflexaceae bacterium]|nr:S8 family peptidase [Roseiflexaceae bacterium]
MKQLRLICLALFALSLAAWRPPDQPVEQVIVIGRSTNQAATAVRAIQGTVERDLRIIDAVAARLAPRQIGYLRSQGLRVAPNARLSATSAAATYTPHTTNGVAPASALGLDRHSRFTGRGVTVALVDSGLPTIPELRPDSELNDGTLVAGDRRGRFLVYHDFTSRARRSQDPYGHGTHIAGTIAGSTLLDRADQGYWHGVAPDVNLVVTRALGADGSGSYIDTIAAIDWIVANKTRYNVRVLNLSLFAPVQSLYWADPLNQAVMRAWQSGLVVVTAAGNNGPDPQSVAVPGNNPYVITVGAYRSAAVSDSGADEVTQWSARGPTPDSGFVKPDVLAPGVRVISGLPRGSALAESAAEGRVVRRTVLDLAGTNSLVGLYQLSGTSMAAAEVSGLAALLLQQRPNLTNNQVKWLLARSANLAVDAQTRQASYSTWEQGFGKVDASALLGYRGQIASANLRMDIARDLDSSSNGQHYVGMTAYDPATGRYSVPVSGDFTSTYFNWCGQFVPWPGSSSLGTCGSTVPSTGSTWSGGGTAWSGGGTAWSGGGIAWSGAGTAWSGNGSTWSGAGTAWSGGGIAWSGGGSSWSGAGSAWSGNGSVWPGGGIAWSGILVSWRGQD